MARPIAGLLTCLMAVGLGRAESAKEILEKTGLNGGLIVHVGCGDGRKTVDLYANDRFLVQGLDREESDVEKARDFIRSKGLYGKVSARTFDGVSLPYIDGLVNLVIVSGDDAQVSRDEILRVLAPRGVAIVEGEKIVKPWPSDMDQWTHWLYGPGNNAVSRDRRVGISRNLQWIMPPSWGRHHNLVPSMSIMVSAGGRIYYIMDEAPIGVKGRTEKWSLVCRDAFNGLLLWKRRIENWGWERWSAIQFGGVMRFKRPDQLFRRLVAVGDVVYVTLGFTEPVVVLDGATGETIRQYEGTEDTSAILCKDDRLILARNVYGEEPGKDILAVNAQTGDVLWERKQYKGITSRGDELKAFMDAYLTLGDENVFFLDEEDIVALDVSSGEEVWRTRRPEMEKHVFGHNQFNFKNFCSLVYHDKRLFLGQLYPSTVNLNKWQQKDMMLWALDAATGKRLWEHKGMSLAHFTPPDLFITSGMAWTMKKDVVALVGLDVRTGEVRREYPVKDMLVGHHHRCYRNKATENLYLAGEEGIEYIDFHSGELDVHHWMRGACTYGVLPANGLIYLPTHACGCHSNVKLHGFFALASRGDRESTERPSRSEDRLAKGPAYSRVSVRSDQRADVGRSPSTHASDWPVYKHDNQRSNCTAAKIPAKLEPAWEAELGGRVTAPVIAGDNVYVGAEDSHQVYCLSAKTGQVRWQFTVDGPVDSPPTCHGDEVIVGSRGGSVYSLAADDGQLIWRFCAAPDDVQLTAFGRLESPWPVHGSALVMDNKVFCVAGRSMHLDSGMVAYALDVKTGKVLQETRLKADIGPKGELSGSVLPDILVSDGTNIYMRDMKLNPNDIREHGVERGNSGRLQPNDGGLLEATWFNSAFWKYKMAAAQMLVFDAQSVYGVLAQNKLISKSYGQDIFTVGDGYRVFRVDPDAAAKRTEKSDAEKGQRNQRKGKRTLARKWERKTAVRAQSMVLTDRCLFIAGAPDTVDDKDPWGGFEDRKGGVLKVYLKDDGSKIAEYKLPSTPIYDGMAAAGGRLFATLRDGTVLCMSKARER